MKIEIKEDKVIINSDIVMSIDTVEKSIAYTNNWLEVLAEAYRMYEEKRITEQQMEFISMACSNDAGCIAHVISMLNSPVNDLE